MELADEIAYKGCKIEVHYDDMPENPFDYQDATGKFVHWKEHGQDEYRLYCELLNFDPDTHEPLSDGKPDPDAIEIDKFEHGAACCYYSLRGEGTQCRWDTSRGWAIWMPDKCLLDELKGLKGKKRRDKCVVYARQACELHNQWANGEVYGIISKDAADNEIGSCWGYFGDDGQKDGIENAKVEIDIHLKEAAKIIPAALGA